MATKQVLRIKAARDGYRRCGVAHSRQAVDHPIDRFSEDQVAILEADPMLVVQVAEVETENPKKGKAGDKA